MSSALYLVRHGAAGEAARDHERVLSAIGRSEVKGLLQEIEGKGVRIDRILHSELARARETAAILAPLSEAPPQSHEGLAPDDDVDVLVAELEDLGGSTMIVSHLPFLPDLCGELLEEISSIPQFRTATAVCLLPAGEHTGRRSWRLAWQINGRDAMLRRE